MDGWMARWMDGWMGRRLGGEGWEEGMVEGSRTVGFEMKMWRRRLGGGYFRVEKSRKAEFEMKM